MSDEQEELLATWYQNLEPHPLDLSESEEDRRSYVELDAWKSADGTVRSLRGRPAVEAILDTIRLSARRRAGSTHLFAGFPGTGKTTELNRLTRELHDSTSAPGFSVLRISAKRYHSMNDALSIEEMAVLLAAGIGEAALESLGEQALPRLRKVGVWENIHGRIRSMFDGGVTFKLGIADIKPALFRGGTSLRDQLREALGVRILDKLREFVHQLVGEIVEAIKPRQVVVLVDDLEKYTVSRLRVASVYQQMAELFFFHGPLLKLPRCHIIYTIPPYLAFLNPGILGAFDDRVHLLPNVKVQSRPPERIPYADGVEALMRMMAMRVDLARLFGNDREICMQRLILACGGHIRDLSSLLREVVLLGVRRSLPLGMREVEEVIAQSAARRGNLLKGDLEILLEVSKFGDLDPLDEERLGAFAGVMDQHLMLCYANSDFWYDAHPIIASKLERARETSSPGLLDD